MVRTLEQSSVSLGRQTQEVDYAKEVAATHVDGTKQGPADPPSLAPLQTHEMALLVAPQRLSSFEGPQSASPYASSPTGPVPDVVKLGSAVRRAKTSSVSKLTDLPNAHLQGSLSRRNAMFKLIGPIHAMMEGIYAQLEKTSA